LNEFYCSTHDCIKQSGNYIFRKLTCGPDFIQGQSQQSLEGIEQGQLFELLAAGEEQVTYRTGVIMIPLFNRKKNNILFPNKKIPTGNSK